tara:strand:+ start:5204 stop:5764 length:561 start_codon:yes stop_codon:yes gene_type:complete
MAEEMTAQAGEETQNQTDLTATQTADVDFKDLYTKEVQNAKLQRQKKQEAEGRLAEIEQKQDEARKNKLQADGEYKVVIQELEEKSAKQEAELKEYRKRDDAERANILESFPEDERDQLSKLDLTTLKYVEKKSTAQTAENPPETPGTISGKTYRLEEVDKLPPKERQAAWAQITKQYAQKSARSQ